MAGDSHAEESDFDVWEFLTVAPAITFSSGAWRYLILVFLALFIASVVIAIRNWQEDPAQRTGRHLGMWFARV
jgi:hypothetical protein